MSTIKPAVVAAENQRRTLDSVRKSAWVVDAAPSEWVGATSLRDRAFSSSRQLSADRYGVLDGPASRVAADYRVAQEEAVERTKRDNEQMRLWKQIASATSGDAVVARVLLRIQAFEEALDEKHEVGLQLVTVGQARLLHVRNIAYLGNSVLEIEGTLDDGSGCALMQHVTQLSFMLVRVRKQDPKKPREPIGFVISGDNTTQTDDTFQSGPTE